MMWGLPFVVRIHVDDAAFHWSPAVVSEPNTTVALVAGVAVGEVNASPSLRNERNGGGAPASSSASSRRRSVFANSAYGRLWPAGYENGALPSSSDTLVTGVPLSDATALPAPPAYVNTEPGNAATMSASVV